LNPKPHVAFHVRCEDDKERTWRIVVYDQDQVPGIDTLMIGDVLSVVGTLSIYSAKDRLGRQRLAFEVVGKQALLLRRRSREKALNGHRPGLEWLATPR